MKRRYTANLFREVVTQDLFSVEIEADGPEDAQAKAAALCAEMDMSCPDGVRESRYTESGAWSVGDVRDGPVPEHVARQQRALARADAEPRNYAPPADIGTQLTGQPLAILEGLLKAAEAGMPALGFDDRDASAGLAVLRLHVCNLQRAS